MKVNDMDISKYNVRKHGLPDSWGAVDLGHLAA